MVRVMVVDDEVPIRQWLEFCIGKLAGYQVVGLAANGAEGFSLYRKTLPEIVITDIRMPVMDGLEMLKLIQNSNPAVVSVVLTSHEDFEYARKAIKLGASEYILKTEITEESLKELLDKAARTMRGSTGSDREKTFEELSNRNHYLRSLVLSQHAGAANEKLLKEYEIPLSQGNYAALDVMAGEVESMRITLPQEGILTNIFKVPLDLNHTLIIGNLDRSGPTSGLRQQEEIGRYCREIIKQAPCRIGGSDIYSSPGRLGDAMRQAHDRVLLHFYYPNTDIFLNQPVGVRQIPNGEKYKIRFSKELVNQNFKKAVEIKESMVEEVRQTRPTDIDYVRKLFLFFLTSLYHITRDDIDKTEQQLGEVGEMVQAADTLEKLELVMEQGFASCGSAAMGNSEYSSSVRSAIRYMEENYAEPLALSDVSSHVGLSAEYLSRLFRDETGVKFVVYLNNLRLKHALRLLETTNLKVYEVAEQVGYSNLSYFSTVFKKNFGQNPFDYKNSCK